MPPLRSRPQDILWLTEQFLEEQARLGQGSVLSLQDLFAERSRSDEEASGQGLPSLEDFVSQAERSYLHSVLELMGGRIGNAAAALGISRKTLWEKMRRHGLKSREPH